MSFDASQRIVKIQFASDRRRNLVKRSKSNERVTGTDIEVNVGKWLYVSDGLDLCCKL